ncbi:MAG: DUF177 domain-containing protein [Actinobacteria bacterium]|nr:DUF177 domain-containing protein [Actinomycetota bacterium]
MNGRYLRVRDLLHRPGEQRHDEGAFAIEPSGTTAARLRDRSDVTYSLTLEAQGRRVTMVGNVRGDWVGPCRRCLEETSGSIDARVSEIFEVSPLPGETWPIVDGVIDLEPPFREALLLELPLAPLCRDDCPGPDPERYPAMSETERVVPVVDPRWAALEGFVADEPQGGTSTP